MNPYRLSYPVGTVNWNGKVIERVPGEKIDRTLEMLKSCGISEVMLTGYTEVEPAEFDLAAGAAEIGAKLKALGMKGAQHHGLAPSYAPLDESQEEVVAQLIRQVEYTAALHADALVLHAGRISGRHTTVDSVTARFQEEVKKHGMERMLRINGENFHRAGEAARKLGVRIALENLDRFEPLSNPELLPRLVAAADSPAVGFCLDSGHAHCCGNSVTEWVRVMGEKLFTTHIHDNRGPRGKVPQGDGFIHPTGIDEHLPPGFGTIPWIDVIQALREAGYEHTLNFESGPWPGMDDQEGYLHAIAFWRRLEYLAEQKPK